MTLALATTARWTWTLTRLYVASSNGAPLHFAACPQGTCATMLAMLVVIGQGALKQLTPSAGGN